jgi:hypothetical protein
MAALVAAGTWHEEEKRESDNTHKEVRLNRTNTVAGACHVRGDESDRVHHGRVA